MGPFIEGAKATGDVTKDHWQTPAFILDRARQTFNGLLFDPCPENPQFDGLSIQWAPYAFINPPFSEYGKWVTHGVKQIGPQIWIANTKNTTLWWQELADYSHVLCLLYKRVSFIDPVSGEPKNTQYGQSQCVFYRGGGPKSFVDAFSDIGRCLPL